ncbi:MAG: glycosyl hydrolase 53 family protein [Lactobacillus sp.]
MIRRPALLSKPLIFYQLLASTVNAQNAGGIILDDAISAGSWTSLFAADGYPEHSLAVFNTAKGVATDLTGNPWRDGTDAGMRTKVSKIKPIANLAANDIRGVDASSYLALKNAGVKYYDFKGRETPLMKVLHDNGVNYLRLRIWNDPKNAAGKYYGGGNNDVVTDLQIAKEATKYGMKVLLCFHYSDSWADPGKQILPKAWKAGVADHVKMRQHVQDFTYQTVKQFVNAGVKVGMVQVGNEITKGAIGIWGTDWTKVWKNKCQSQLLDSYLKAGVKGARGAAPKALVAFHLESPDVAKYQTIMNDWKSDGVDYDVLGTSFYPFWWNTTQRLHDIQNLAARYGKLFVVLETAWPHTLQNADGTANNIGSDTVMPHPYKISPQGQADQLAAMTRL